MSQLELLKKIVGFLNQFDIDYMLTGSIVSSLQGEPRSTHDIDILIQINEKDIENILNSFRMPNFYIDEESIKDAIKNNGMFNLIDVLGGDKIDFWILTNSDFDKSRFSRKINEDFMNIAMFISSPEDTILAKLMWSKISGGSKKQIIDALRVYEVQNNLLDLNYLNEWIDKLDLSGEWEKIMKIV